MIFIKTKKEIEMMKESGKRLSAIMNEVEKIIEIGISTKKIDDLVEKMAFSCGGFPAFKGYQNFPSSACVSVNNEIVHGIPSESKILENGDLVKVDIGLSYEKMITDMARTFVVGETTAQAKELVETTKEVLDLGIEQIKPGNKIYDYAKTVEDYATRRNFFVCKNLVGHGVGREVHEDPYIPNYISGANEENVIFKKGMTLALEPMLNIGTFETKLGKDGSVWETKDGSLSAHFEDTIVITENGCEILTRN